MTKRQIPLALAFLVVAAVFSPLVAGSRGQEPTVLSLPYPLWTSLGASVLLLFLLGIAARVETTTEESNDERP